MAETTNSEKKIKFKYITANRDATQAEKTNQDGTVLFDPKNKKIYVRGTEFDCNNTTYTTETFADANHTHAYITNTKVDSPARAADAQNLHWYSQVSQASGYAGTNAGFPVSNNANGILWLGTHPKFIHPQTGVEYDYGGQLGVSSNGNLYYRYINGYAFPNTANGGSWNRILFSNNLGYNTSEKNYAVQADGNNNLFVNVPWTDATLYWDDIDLDE